MQKIKQLSAHEAQKIAAGEVVERPSNVVKELVENSLDAGATAITIYIEQAGKKLIRIVDNGCGMSNEDAILCFVQHATSKITSVEDLPSIATFGFRGEALSSIAAVSNITLITKEEVAELGTKVVLEQGTVRSQESIGCASGTDITIAELFFNVPARKKFLRSDDTEWRSILHLMHAFCLDYTNIHFKLFHDGKQIINCPPTQELIKRCAQLWDHNFANHLLTIDGNDTKAAITISGVITNHQYARYDRNQIYLFVNRRWIKNQQLSSALLKGYMNVLPTARYPAAALFITVDPAQVDINIHPRKEEVQFLHPNKVATLVSTTVKKTLEENLSVQLRKTVSIAPPAVEHAYTQQPFRGQSTFKPFDFDNFLAQPATSHIETFNQTTRPTIEHTPSVTPPVEQFTDTNLSISHAPDQQPEENYTIIGQYNKTYILLEQTEGLFLIDQHAAHERVLYELFSQRFNEVATIKLLFPPVVTLSTTDADLIEQHQELFKKHGIEVERFGAQQIVVQSAPVHIKDIAMDDLLRQTAQWITEAQTLDQEQFAKTLHEKLHAQMACTAAVKAGDTLGRLTMEQLLQDLYKTTNRFTCPHGRPTGWLLSLHEIEKKFKRNYR